MNVYDVTLPDGSRVRIWFTGEQIETIFKSYNVKYKKSKYKGW